MDWNKYFLGIAEAVAKNSKCHSRQIGAVLVRDKRIISTGYNGPPVGIPHCEGPPCPRYIKGYKSGEGLEICPAAHAERNCLITAARMGHATLGADMYMTCGVPCKDCMIEIINAGIKTLYVTKMVYYDELSKWLLKESNINVHVIS